MRGALLPEYGRVMASGSGAWLDDRRSWGIVSAVAASVVAAMSLIDLDEVFLRDVVTAAAAVGVYLVYGAVPAESVAAFSVKRSNVWRRCGGLRTTNA
jgi:hypothetical protein